MNLLLFLLILALALCQNQTLIGYIHIDNKLVSEIIGNTDKPLQIEVGIKELFAIVLATTSPLRWYLYTPEAYPYIMCKQKIIDKNAKTDEVIQLFGCKMPYKGESFISIGLGTSDTRVKTPRKINVRINVNSTLEMQGPNLTEPVPTEIPTIPPPKEVNKANLPKEKETPKPNQNQNQNRNQNRDQNRNQNRNQNNRNTRDEDDEEKKNPYESNQRRYTDRMKEYFKNMKDDFGSDDYFDDDYWSPNRYRSRNNNRSPYGNANNRGFPYDSMYDDDYYL